MKDDEAKPKLESALRDLARDRIFIPPDSERATLRAIHEHFGTKHEASPGKAASKSEVIVHRLKYKAWQKWIPLAASIAIAAIVLYFSRPTQSDHADFNLDGAVDVVDALLFAEQLRAGKGRDINNDRAVNETDTTEILARAVDLERKRS